MGTGGANYKKQKEEASRQRKIKTQILRCEAEIEELEERQRQIEAEISLPETVADYEKLAKFTAALDEIKEKLNEALEEWEELSTL